MERTFHLLVVDDDREIRDLLSRFLKNHGYRVDTAADGRRMFELLADGRYDLVVLDLMLPGEDGLSLCRRLRAQKISLPVVMLTALGEETDRIVGLEVGADDYIAKPFNPRELLARIRAVLRRAGTGAGTGAGTNAGEPQATAAGNSRGNTLGFSGWRLDLLRRELRSPDGLLVTLTSGEFDLLVALAERAGRVLSRDQLLDLTRGREALPCDRSIDVLLSRLRRKIETDPKQPGFIKTVRGGGYLFAAPVERL
ncbi:MAG: response regulator [Nitrospirota bacterium]|nr:response regulator [Nitrospirota bacterium]